MQILRFVLLISLIIYIITPEKLDCMPHKKGMRNFMLMGYSFHSIGTAHTGHVIQHMINLKTREWLVLRLDMGSPLSKDLRACTVYRGDKLVFGTEMNGG